MRRSLGPGFEAYLVDEDWTFRPRSGFLFWPRRVGTDWRWLEYAHWIEEWCYIPMDSYWKICAWVDDGDYVKALLGVIERDGLRSSRFRNLDLGTSIERVRIVSGVGVVQRLGFPLIDEVGARRPSGG